MTHAWTRELLLLCVALACVNSACGKYGPPQRIGANANGVEAAATTPEPECEDEEKRP